MKAEKPKLVSLRLYKTHRKALKSQARKQKISEAEVVRRLIQERYLYEDGTLRYAELI
jgi:hypothetical protein